MKVLIASQCLVWLPLIYVSNHCIILKCLLLYLLPAHLLYVSR